MGQFSERPIMRREGSKLKLVIKERFSFVWVVGLAPRLLGFGDVALQRFWAAAGSVHQRSVSVVGEPADLVGEAIWVVEQLIERGAVGATDPSEVIERGCPLL